MDDINSMSNGEKILGIFSIYIVTAIITTIILGIISCFGKIPSYHLVLFDPALYLSRWWDILIFPIYPCSIVIYCLFAAPYLTKVFSIDPNKKENTASMFYALGAVLDFAIIIGLILSIFVGAGNGLIISIFLTILFSFLFGLCAEIVQKDQENQANKKSN